jgi:hypothetical protein
MQTALPFTHAFSLIPQSVNIFSFFGESESFSSTGMPISAGSRYHDELIFTAVRIAASRCLASTLNPFVPWQLAAYQEFRIIFITISPFRSPSESLVPYTLNFHVSVCVCGNHVARVYAGACFYFPWIYPYR